MQKVNFKHVLKSLLLTAVLLVVGVQMASAQAINSSFQSGQGQSGASNGLDKVTFVSKAVAIQKLQNAYPALNNQLAGMNPDAANYKKKHAEVMAYKLMLSNLNSSYAYSVESAFLDGTNVTLAEGFNLNNAADASAYRTAKKAILTLLTTP